MYGGNGDASYSYTYRIDENAGTVELVDSFPVPYSSIVSNATLNPDTGHWAVNSGVAMVYGEYDSQGNLIRPVCLRVHHAGLPHLQVRL